MPSDSKAPGYKRRRNKDGTVRHLWVARADIVKQGYAPKTVRLHYDDSTSEGKALIAAACMKFQSEMLAWKAGYLGERNVDDGLIGGLVIQIVLAFYLHSLHWLYVGAIAQVLIMMLAMVVSLFTAPPRPDQVEPFTWRASWLRAYDENAPPRPWWQQIKIWFAIYAFGWCYIYWRFW